MANPFTKAIEEAASQTNMNEASKGGGDYTPPAAGLVRLRFVGYIELGKHDHVFQGKTSQREFVKLIFEASGPKHPPREDGTPIMFTLTLNLSTNEKAAFYKLFKRMSAGKKVTHMAELLGEAYIGTVIHNVVKDDNGGKDRTFANLKDAEGVWTIREPFIDVPDAETGEVERKVVQVADPITPLRCFLWDYADKPMWDSLFIDGQWDEVRDDNGVVKQAARTKNVHQEYIKQAHNWVGSKMQEMLFAGGEADIPDTASAGTASDDPLEGAG